MDALERQAFIEAKLLVYREGLTVDEDMPATLQIATQRIHERLFRRNLTVKRLRRRLGLTSATFSARFRRYHGRSPARYIRWLRVNADDHHFVDQILRDVGNNLPDGTCIVEGGNNNEIRHEEDGQNCKRASEAPEADQVQFFV